MNATTTPSQTRFITDGSTVIVFTMFAVMIMLVFASQTEPQSIADPGDTKHQTDPLAVAPEPEGKLQKPISVRTLPADRRAFANHLSQDVRRHGGFVTEEARRTLKLQVSQQYLQRLAPLAQASAEGKPEEAYQDWTELPPEKASAPEDAVIETRVLLSDQTQTKTTVASWFWPATAAVAVIGLAIIVLVTVQHLRAWQD